MLHNIFLDRVKREKYKLTTNRDYVKELLNIISKESKYWKSTLEIFIILTSMAKCFLKYVLTYLVLYTNYF